MIQPLMTAKPTWLVQLTSFFFLVSFFQAFHTKEIDTHEKQRLGMRIYFSDIIANWSKSMVAVLLDIINTKKRWFSDG